jgi:hypothetical protein
MTEKEAFVEKGNFHIIRVFYKNQVGETPLKIKTIDLIQNILYIIDIFA